MSEKFFSVEAKKYDPQKDFDVFRPSSLNNPKCNSVMFVTKGFLRYWEQLLKVDNCIVIWPDSEEIPEEVLKKHVIIRHPEPRQGFAMFFRENEITNHPQIHDFQIVGGAYICKGASIGEDTVVFPGAYLDAEVEIGKRCIIGSGVKLIGRIKIGDDVIIHENAVIGSDGLTTRRDENGRVVSTPQFGGVIIEDNVHIGALTVIARGAIDDTIIRSGCRIDNSVFISHNVVVGEDTLIVGETIMFGSSSTGERAFLSGNSAIRDGVSIGNDATIGMGAVVVKPVEPGATVKGNPAK